MILGLNFEKKIKRTILSFRDDGYDDSSGFDEHDVHKVHEDSNFVLPCKQNTPSSPTSTAKRASSHDLKQWNDIHVDTLTSVTSHLLTILSLASIFFIVVVLIFITQQFLYALLDILSYSSSLTTSSRMEARQACFHAMKCFMGRDEAILRTPPIIYTNTSYEGTHKYVGCGRQVEASQSKGVVTSTAASVATTATTASDGGDDGGNRFRHKNVLQVGNVNELKFICLTFAETKV
ncbi:hypothetical protein HELRODRAFT_162100 [Helobdella robusta]|uniref:Uncharacterized protein n=1 Tax=Helobdella robusta TaxID=6412 RepID=T1ES88_HELRO|nr:hypothetical protein HELRODRAFT_162100 [Helobdella robusta]ESN98655.1 hypothetical protein HELRODRAFT_162100 [Helobdella robusta]